MLLRKRFFILTLVAVLLALNPGFAPRIFAQAAQPTFTTLAAALTANASSMKVTSATGFTASTGNLDYLAFIDHELVRLTTVNSTTIGIQRGVSRTGASAHLSGAYVVVGPAPQAAGTASGQTGGPFISTPMNGTCTASAYPILPLIQVNPNSLGGQAMYNCQNGFWVAQTLLNTLDSVVPGRVCTPPGLQSLSLLTSFGSAGNPFDVGNNLTPVSGTVYYGTIYMPETRVLTGLSGLNGSVAGTDSLLYGLWRSDGAKVLANTLVAGTTASGILRFQDIAFTSSVIATGPARYWVGVQTNGTTTRLRTINLTPGATTAGLGEFVGVKGSNFTGTFGTLPTLLAGGSPATGALPTTLINASAPIMCAY